ncbi:MAG TPA: vanadium-dependent haloperoxidase [Gemmatimonadaceae bacterium]
MYSRFSHRFHWRAASALAGVITAALTAACDVPTTTPRATPSDARQVAAAAVAAPPVSLEWQGVARAQVATNNMSALAASRLYAALSVAQARAVAAVDADAGVQGVGAGNGYGAGGRALYEARRGAVAGASVRVLGWFSAAASAALEQRLAEQGEAGPGGVHPEFTRGVAVGRAIGDAMVTRLTNDNFTRAWNSPVPSGAGIWTPSSLPPAGGTLGQATPWFLNNNSQFRPPPPPAYLSPAFNTDLAVVVTTTTNLTPPQLAIALGWAYGANTMTPGGYWDGLAAQYVAADGLDEARATEVFAIMNAAVYDALIACFEAKYFYWTLRPHQADPAVVRAFTVPNYPSYPSGHQALSASAARVLTHYFPARAATIDALRAEASISRVYAGIHYPFDMSAARTLGEGVADFAIAKGLP